MKRIIGVAFLTLTVVASVFASSMTPDEVAVRSTYAKLAYAAQLGDVHQAIRKDKRMTLGDLESLLANSQVKFQISDLSTGPISQIAKTRYSELLSKPDGSDVLAVAPDHFRYVEEMPDGTTKETKELHAQLRWTAGQNLSEDWEVPFEKVLSVMENSSFYSRYAAFTVTVRYQGRTRSYKALFLFGTDKQGSPDIFPIDTVSNNSALRFFAKEDVYPTTLLETSLREKAVVSDWLAAHQMDDAKCRGGKKAVCCDPTTLQCGVTAKDIRSALERPI